MMMKEIDGRVSTFMSKVNFRDRMSVLEFAFKNLPCEVRTNRAGRGKVGVLFEDDIKYINCGMFSSIINVLWINKAEYFDCCIFLDSKSHISHFETVLDRLSFPVKGTVLSSFNEFFSGLSPGLKDIFEAAYQVGVMFSTVGTDTEIDTVTYKTKSLQRISTDSVLKNRVAIGFDVRHFMSMGIPSSYMEVGNSALYFAPLKYDECKPTLDSVYNYICPLQMVKNRDVSDSFGRSIIPPDMACFYDHANCFRILELTSFSVEKFFRKLQKLIGFEDVIGVIGLDQMPNMVQEYGLDETLLPGSSVKIDLAYGPAFAKPNPVLFLLLSLIAKTNGSGRGIQSAYRAIDKLLVSWMMSRLSECILLASSYFGPYARRNKGDNQGYWPREYGYMFKRVMHEHNIDRWAYHNGNKMHHYYHQNREWWLWDDVLTIDIIQLHDMTSEGKVKVQYAISKLSQFYDDLLCSLVVSGKTIALFPPHTRTRRRTVKDKGSKIYRKGDRDCTYGQLEKTKPGALTAREKELFPEGVNKRDIPRDRVLPGREPSLVKFAWNKERYSR
jgi:hypothetical protein